MDLQSFNAKAQGGSFELLAIQEVPLTALTNVSDHPVEVTITSTGRWSLINFETSDPKLVKYKTWTDGDGYVRDQNDKKYKFKYPHLNPAALVAEIKDAQGNVKSSFGGKEQNLKLQPGDTLSFIINDDPGYFKNNLGSLTISYSIAI
ncbi:hypothetical protein [Dolichospermum circinale]|uniref:hypothetical protein n=1 Tax=Dolichospermum circinale TaxID=109265 RepID=UPI00232FE87C|nr:hypothetical protein [Dolichospermum circinale]MDB9468880.1 hypothetical protein [Dolichospermum circinale CS-539/09]MDB9469944.1 hypothetical protein [Dolichospermum circinale CS-539]